MLERCGVVMVKHQGRLAIGSVSGEILGGEDPECQSAGLKSSIYLNIGVDIINQMLWRQNVGAQIGWCERL